MSTDATVTGPLSALAKWLQDHAPPGAKAYRLVSEVNGHMVLNPAPPMPGWKMGPLEMPLAASGQYALAFEDQSGKLMATSENLFSWDFPAKRTASAAPKEETDIEDVRLSLEAEQNAAEASTLRAKAASFNDTLGLYRAFTQVMGTQSALELKVKNEQFALLNQACSKLLETQVELMDTFRQHAANLRTPQPPPQWDKIVAAGAPAFAAMYVETVRAIKGETRKTKGPSTDDLLTPVDEKLSKLYELLGNIASNDRLEVLLKDPEKLQTWMQSVQSFMSSGPKTEDSAE